MPTTNDTLQAVAKFVADNGLVNGPRFPEPVKPQEPTVIRHPLKYVILWLDGANDSHIFQVAGEVTLRVIMEYLRYRHTQKEEELAQRIDKSPAGESGYRNQFNREIDWIEKYKEMVKLLPDGRLTAQKIRFAGVEIGYLKIEEAAYYEIGEAAQVAPE